MNKEPNKTKLLHFPKSVKFAEAQSRQLGDGSFEARCPELWGNAIGKGKTQEEAFDDLEKNKFAP